MLFTGKEGGDISASPMRSVSIGVDDARKGQELVQSPWGVDSAGVEPPVVGSNIVDRAAGDAKLGALVAFSPGKS